MDWLVFLCLYIVEVLMICFIVILLIFLLGFYMFVVFVYLVFIFFYVIFIYFNVCFCFFYLCWLIVIFEFYYWYYFFEKFVIDKNYVVFILFYDVIFKLIYMFNYLVSVYGIVGYKILNSFVK